MIKPKLDNVIKYTNEDGTIVGGHIGGNEPVGYKYLHKKQILLKSAKNNVKKENKK